ncbi:flagellar hook-associated protein 1 FlgK [Malonomonas rubra DSM 5091]|uniref:Flagellar hook-associated protein 1 n=1 Tax=Malonomonas rubra DSM 5091 TaxID=1122189 RepID=A0A1M6MAN6_MALRU|nr:flagellar hook-associated protein FlgK [Malonomonas rubra]SHJ80497.1 flagellar hook-associated protein 1 FlgK [Malonomonas rubra DSM 5091]
MAGLNAALNSGRTSLQTNQKAIEITGLNIANVNTEGYSRQTPNMTPYPALSFGDYFIGTGVTVGSVMRSHDVFLDGQIKDKSADVGLESSMTNPLAELERVVSIGDGSLSDEFDQFFDAWRQLSTNPGGEVERQMVLQRGELIGNAFVNVYNETQQSVTNINNTISSKIDGVNLHLDEIAQLNNRISSLELAGQEANSDRDRRDMLLKNLSEMIGASSFETSNGTVSVHLKNGMPLVEGNEATHIVGVYSGTEVNLELDFGTTNLALDRTALGGEFRGLYEVRDVMIPDVVNRLDQLAYTFANEVNAQHTAGTDLSGAAGQNFFVAPAAVAGSAASLTMNITQTSEIAAGTTGAPGDNTNALAILQLEQKQQADFGGNDTFVSYYGKIASTVGVETARNRQASQGYEDSLIQLQNLRDGIDGVSLEDEMINLMQYQKGFEASAKFLSTVDEMMGTLLTLKS